MGIFLNNKLNNIEKSKYENNIKTFSGYLNNYFESKTIDVVASGTVFKSIAFNPDNGYMIAISESTASGNNFFMSSDGGENWSSNYSVSGSLTFNNIIFENNKYIAVGNNGKIIYTSSAIPISSDWNIAFNIPPNDFTCITYGNGYYVSLSNTGNNRAIASSDGILWTIKDIESRLWKNICYSPELKRFVAISSDSYSSYSNFNGEEWITNVLPSGVWSSIAWSSKLKIFVAVANSGANRIIYSNDGISWSVLSDSSIISDWNNIIWSQELEIFIAVSGSGKIITSPNGLKWTFRNSPSTNYQKIIWNNYYGNLIIISSNLTSSKIIINKSLGINSLLSSKNYYYYEDDSFSYSQNDVLMLAGNNYYFYPNLNEKLGFTYSISPSLPNGLSLNPNTGEIKGLLNISLDRIKYKITATNSQKKLITYIYISASTADVSLSNFYYLSNNTISLEVNSPINLIPKIKGTYPITYSLISNTPFSGSLNLNLTTGVISGNSGSISSNFLCTIKAQNSISFITNTLNIKINDKTIDDFNYNYTIPSTVSSQVSYLPSINRGTNIIYTISPPLNNKMPNLTIDQNTGEIKGVTPSTPQSETYTITATNNINSQIQKKYCTFTINVIDITISDFNYGTNNFFEVNNNDSFNITPTPFPNIGSNITWSISPSLPSQISFNSTTGSNGGKIIGVPNFYFSKNFTITATNSVGNKQKILTLKNNFLCTITSGAFDVNLSGGQYLQKGYLSGKYGSLNRTIFNEIIINYIYVYFDTNNPTLNIFYPRYLALGFRTTEKNINLNYVSFNGNNGISDFYVDNGSIINDNSWGTSSFYYKWNIDQEHVSPFNALTYDYYYTTEYVQMKLVQKIT